MRVLRIDEKRLVMERIEFYERIDNTVKIFLVSGKEINLDFAKEKEANLFIGNIDSLMKFPTDKKLIKSDFSLNAEN
ncbi:hypothetical protein ACYUFO_002227 [Vibrio parahaemolyticus]